jgi:hypothetical protein
VNLLCDAYKMQDAWPRLLLILLADSEGEREVDSYTGLVEREIEAAGGENRQNCTARTPG